MSSNENNSNSVVNASSTTESFDITYTPSKDEATEEYSSEVSTVSDTDNIQPLFTTHTTAETTTGVTLSLEESVESTDTTIPNKVDHDTGGTETVSTKATSEQNEDEVTSIVGFTSELTDVFNSTNSSLIYNVKTVSTRIASTSELTTDSWVSEIPEITTGTSDISAPERDHQSTTITIEAGDVYLPETEYESTTITTTFPVSDDETDNLQNFISTSMFDDDINYTLSLPEVSI